MKRRGLAFTALGCLAVPLLVYAWFGLGGQAKIALLVALLGMGAVVVTFWQPEAVRAKVSWLVAFVGLSLGTVLLTHTEETKARRDEAEVRQETATQLRLLEEEARSAKEDAQAAKSELATLIMKSSARILDATPPGDRTLLVGDLSQLRAKPYRYSVVATEGDSESMKLAISLMAILDEAGWQSVTVGYAVAEYGGPMEGVWVFAHAQNTPGAAALARLLEDSEIVAKVVARPNMNPEDRIDINIGKNVKVISHQSMPGMTSMAGASSLLASQ